MRIFDTRRPWTWHHLVQRSATGLSGTAACKAKAPRPVIPVSCAFGSRRARRNRCFGAGSSEQRGARTRKLRGAWGAETRVGVAPRCVARGEHLHPGMVDERLTLLASSTCWRRSLHRRSARAKAISLGKPKRRPPCLIIFSISPMTRSCTTSKENNWLIAIRRGNTPLPLPAN